MSKQETFEKLNRIKKVAVPPFLYTRIEAEIENLHQRKAPFEWKLAACGLVGILLFAHVIMLNNHLKNAPQNEVVTIANQMNLHTSSQLYYE